MPMGRLAQMLLLVMAAASCAGLGPQLEPPEVSLVGLRTLRGGALEQRFELQLRVLNPNNRELRIDGIEFTLDVNGSRLTRGVSNEGVTLPRLGEALTTVTATTTVVDLLGQVINAVDSPDLRYELRGRVFLAGSPGGLGFSRSGTVATRRRTP